MPRRKPKKSQRRKRFILKIDTRPKRVRVNGAMGLAGGGSHDRGSRPTACGESSATSAKAAAKVTTQQTKDGDALSADCGH